MIRYSVNDMTCGHCVQAITQAVQALDAQAVVDIDLPTHVVAVQSGAASAEAITAAITEAGFSPQPMPPGGPAD